MLFPLVSPIDLGQATIGLPCLCLRLCYAIPTFIRISLSCLPIHIFNNIYIILHIFLENLSYPMKLPPVLGECHLPDQRPSGFLNFRHVSFRKS